MLPESWESRRKEQPELRCQRECAWLGVSNRSPGKDVKSEVETDQESKSLLSHLLGVQPSANHLPPLSSIFFINRGSNGTNPPRSLRG